MLNRLLCFLGWHVPVSYYDEDAYSITVYCSKCGVPLK